MLHVNADEDLVAARAHDDHALRPRADAQLLTAADSRLDGEHHAGVDGRPIVAYQPWPLVDSGADLVAAAQRTVEALAPEDPARRGDGLAGECECAGAQRLHVTSNARRAART